MTLGWYTGNNGGPYMSLVDESTYYIMIRERSPNSQGPPRRNTHGEDLCGVPAEGFEDRWLVSRISSV